MKVNIIRHSNDEIQVSKNLQKPEKERFIGDCQLETGQKKPAMLAL